MTTHDLPPGVARPVFNRGVCWLLATLLCTSCSTGKKEPEHWNSLHVWHQVATQPPTYLPTGYGADQPRTEDAGTWFTDSRDGKRLFVPKQAVRGLQPGVLTVEAKKATGFDGKPRLTAGEKAWWATMFVLGGLARVSVPPPD